jgi:hypothetical protein
MADTTAAGWHPDPSGRFEFRWWDGGRWTDQVSVGGMAQTDAPAEAAPAASGAATQPAQPAAAGSMLDAPKLSIDFSNGGIGGTGVWGVLDPAGGYLGRMLINPFRIGQKAWYVVEDNNGQLLFRIDPEGGFLNTDLIARDPSGREVGELDLTSSDMRLFAPGPDPTQGKALWGRVDVQGLGGLRGLGPVRSNGATIFSNTNQPVGQVTVIENQRGLLSTQQPAPSWFHIDRDPAMPDPLRTLVLLVPIGIAVLVTNERYNQRHHRTHHSGL